MTRRVNFSADQRVDQPEVQALQQFGTEDDRRIVRMALLGRAQSETRVLRGFKVTPESPATARVIVTHDLGAAGEGAFVGAENMVGNRDYGTIVGGVDGADNLEGPAQQILDFTAQVIGTYDVKVRAGFVTGIPDNRAFWNPSTDMEVVRQTDTRRLPTWEAAYSGHAGGEWVLLASVVWNGATITAADITDKRNFALEGFPNPTATAAQKWSHAVQSETTGVGDFDRSHGRDDPTIGLFGLWEFVRALARQVQDLKGAREDDQRFDWYSRVFAPPGFRNGTVPQPIEYTKNLRSIDTVTFTVAGGADEGGDFTGTYGLVNCFKFIEDNAADLPGRILIMVKDRRTVAQAQFVYRWNQNIVIPDKHIGLIGVQGAVEPSAATPLFQIAEGQLAVGFDIPLDTVGLKLTGGGGLYCENLFFYEDVEGGATLRLVEVEPRGYLQARNCSFTTAALPNETRPQLRCGSDSLILDRCYLNGTSFIGGRATTAFPVTAEPDNFRTGGYVRNSVISGLLRLRHKDSLGIGEQLLVAQGVHFERVTFVPTTLASPRVFGQIDARGTRQLTWHDCQFEYSGDQDCLRFGDLNLGGVYVATRDARVEANLFKMAFSATHAGFVGGAGGVNGSEGTGWAIKLHASSTITAVTQLAKGIHISKNRFTPDLSLSYIDTSPDAGCVSIVDAREVHVTQNDVREWTQPRASALDVQPLILARRRSSAVAFRGCEMIWIAQNFFGEWRETTTGQVWGTANQYLNCVRIDDAVHVSVTDNVFSALDESGARIDPQGLPAALQIIDASNILVAENKFLEWRSATDELDSTCIGIAGVNSDLHFNSNIFRFCGGDNITAFPGADLVNLVFNNNRFRTGNTATDFASCIDLSVGGLTTTEHIHCVGNWWNYQGAAKLAIHVGNASRFSVVSNYFDDGNITHATAGGSPTANSFGYAEPGQDLNFLGSGAYL